MQAGNNRIRVSAALYTPVYEFEGLPWYLSGKEKKKKTCLPRQKTQVQSLDWEDSMEEEMATHTTILAWKIPWTEEPGGLQFMGSQRVRHDLANKRC